MDMKKCTSCKETLPIESFDLKRKDGDSRHSRCRSCRREYQRAYMERRRGKTYQRKYGITEQQYQLMLEAQDHKCAVCSTPSSELPKRMAVDHCHTTGKVRGLLCLSCNTLLGHAKDNSDYLFSAVMYLRGSGTCRSTPV